jgi:hypothetical protein
VQRAPGQPFGERCLVDVGQRQRLVDNRQFFHNEQGRLLGEYDSMLPSDKQEHVWFNGQLVAVVRGGIVCHVDPGHAAQHHAWQHRDAGVALGQRAVLDSHRLRTRGQRSHLQRQAMRQAYPGTCLAEGGATSDSILTDPSELMPIHRAVQ